jgi:hypothetical protein
VDWRAIKTNLANAYMLPGARDARTDAQAAYRHLSEVLAVEPRDERSPHWAMLQDNLAALLAERGVGDRADDLQRAAELAGNAARVFKTLGMPDHRIKSLINVSRAWIEMGPLFIRRKHFDEPEGIGARLGVLDNAEAALREAQSILDQVTLRDARPRIYQSLAEVAMQRAQFLDQDTAGEAMEWLARAAAAAGDDVVRAAYIEYLRAKVALHLFSRERVGQEELLSLLDQGERSNRALGNLGRAGECYYWRAKIRLRSQGLAGKEVNWHAAQDEYRTALELELAGTDFSNARECMADLIRIILLQKDQTAATAANACRGVCELAITAARYFPGYRGIFLAYLASALMSVAERFGAPALNEEAMAALVSADTLITEREHPLEWAQLQLLLDRFTRGLTSPADKSRAPAEAVARAREILGEMGEMKDDNSSQMKKFLEFIDTPAGGTAEPGAQLETRPPPKDGNPRVQVSLEDSRPPVKRPRPQYSLESDYRRYESIDQELTVLNRVRVAGH